VFVLALVLGACTPTTAFRAPPDSDPSAEELEAAGLLEDPAFAYGANAGDVDADAAQLVTFVDGAGPLTLHLARWTSEGWRSAGRRSVSVRDDGFARLLVDGLRPGTDYRYTFVRQDEKGNALGRSPFGRFRTAPSLADRSPFTLLMTGDTGASYRPFEVAARAAAEDADAMVFAGDFVYADERSPDAEVYRKYYRENWSDPSLRQMYLRQSVYGAWDDHDLYVDWNGSTVDPAMVTAAHTALTDFVGIRDDAKHPERMWRAFRWGSVADVILLDTRSEVIPEGPGRQYFGPEQVAWLKDRLTSVDTTFKFIVISLPLGTWPVYCTERLANYPEQKTEILDFIHEEGLENVYWLSADHHAAIVTEVPQHQGYNIVAGALGAEMLGSTIGQLLYFDPTVVYVNGDPFNYVRIVADPETDPPEARVAFVDASGQPFWEATLSRDTPTIPREEAGDPACMEPAILP
jgi:alkaline phosphatase D